MIGAGLFAVLLAGASPGTLAGEGGGEVAWDAIVLHHTGTADGSAASIDEYQRRVLGDPDGIDHHFVIGNGHGAADGLVESTEAWERGRRTTHVFRRGDLPPALSIALVGRLDTGPATAAQMGSAADLVGALARRFAIPADRILLHREIERTGCPGERFDKIALLERAGLSPPGPTRLRVDIAAARIRVERGEAVLQRLRLTRIPAGMPTGTFRVCRRDPAGAFGALLVLGWPRRSEVEEARDRGAIRREDAERLLEAISGGHCPPDDTPLGGEIAVHGPVPVDEPGRCLEVEARDVGTLDRVGASGMEVLVEDGNRKSADGL